MSTQLAHHDAALAFAALAIADARDTRSRELTARDEKRALWRRRADGSLTAAVLDVLGDGADTLLTWQVEDTEPDSYMTAHAVIPADPAPYVLRWLRDDVNGDDVGRFTMTRECGHCGHTEAIPVRSLADVGRLLDTRRTAPAPEVTP